MPITNRQLYQRVTGFETERRLEDYLRALWAITRPHRDEPITANRVANLFERALVAEPAAFDPSWYTTYEITPDDTGEPYRDWENTILFQITDLRRMDDEGIIDDDERYFGLTSPSGAHWYNFDPVTYLECGVRGLVGGFEADEVVVLVPSDDGDHDSPVFPLDSFGWDDFTELLWFGQHYE